MVQTSPSTKTVGLERSIMPAPADPWTTAESRQSLALDETPPSSLPNIIYGQEPFPLEQCHRETDEPKSDIVVRYAGNSPRKAALRRLFNFIRRPRSTASKYLKKSRIDPEPSSLPPLPLGSSILDDPHEESPVVQSLLDTPESHDVKFPRMSSVTDGPRGAGTEPRPFEDVYGSPSIMGDSTDVPKDDIGSSRSASPDSNGPRKDDLPPEGTTSLMDLPTTGRLSSERSLEIGDRPMATNEQFPDDASSVEPMLCPEACADTLPPVTLADSTFGSINPPQSLPTMPRTENVANAPAVVRSRPSKSGIQHGAIVPFAHGHRPYGTWASPPTPQSHNKFAVTEDWIGERPFWSSAQLGACQGSRPPRSDIQVDPIVLPPPGHQSYAAYPSPPPPWSHNKFAATQDWIREKEGEQVPYPGQPPVITGPSRPSRSGTQHGDIVTLPGDDGSFATASFDLPQRHNKFTATQDWIRRKEGGQGFPTAQPPDVVGPPRPSKSGIQHDAIVPFPDDNGLLVTTSINLPTARPNWTYEKPGEQNVDTWSCAETIVVPGPPRPSGSGTQHSDTVPFLSDDGSFVNAGEQVAHSGSWAETTVVAGPPRPSGSGIQRGDIIFFPDDDQPVTTSSKDNHVSD
ncbi:hypothetical protein EDC04DRAFT_289983 [Pisolithus marmoratus]|nr:hypothetical protein EDC04DRAFT_289983 [Pisolithus marmoratus]